MNRFFRKTLIISSLILFTVSQGFAATFFSGYSGAKINYCADEESSKYNPDISLQGFFAGQFNFSQNLWSHLEFSIDTDDLANNSFFNGVSSIFQLDELSLTMRAVANQSSNYFSAFAGTYDPIGSDIFLQRYFGLEPVASKLAESYLGLAGSILYPHFGVGISDVLRLYSAPVAFGAYLYINDQNSRYYVLNADARFAAALPYFTIDFACGLGAPLADTYKGEDVIVAIDTLYWHAGTTILLGNNYTQGLFIQAGIFNASFGVHTTDSIVSSDDLYILFEPRFLINRTHLNLSVFCLPEATVEKFIFVEDTLGADLNVYTTAITIKNKAFNIGCHASIGLVDKTFMDAIDYKNYKNLISNGMNINFTPYFSTNFLTGELNGQVKVRAMAFATGEWYKAFTASVGYKTKF